MSTETRTVLQPDDFLPLDYLAIVLAAVSGVIHLYEGYEDFGEGILPVLFVLAGVGFFVWIGLLVLQVRQRALYLAGIAFTGVQFVGYFALRWPEIYEPLGLVDKAVQLLLVVALAVLYRQKT